jgi:hypothetical protein
VTHHPYEVRVVVDRREPVHVFWVLVLAMIVWVFLKWILLAAVLVGTALGLWLLLRRERLRVEGLSARADLQHAQTLSGDVRGIYGDWGSDEGPRTPATEGR